VRIDFKISGDPEEHPTSTQKERGQLPPILQVKPNNQHR